MAGLSGLPGLAPQAVQGNLNRVSTHVVVANFPTLSASASYMGKSQVKVSFEDVFVQQIVTATGVVNSPEPFVMANATIALLRSQALSNLWIQQATIQATLGNITIFPDSTTFSPITVLNCSITHFDPGAFDGSDPVVSVTVRGSWPANSTMWASLTGALATLI